MILGLLVTLLLVEAESLLIGRQPKIDERNARPLLWSRTAAHEEREHGGAPPNRPALTEPEKCHEHDREKEVVSVVLPASCWVVLLNDPKVRLDLPLESFDVRSINR